MNPPGCVSSALVVVRRNLIHIKRMPELLLDVTIQPVMFVLLFAFVFGGSIERARASNYREFLVPGIMAQTMVFSSFIVAIGLINDLEKGFVDRLQVAADPRSSILVGRQHLQPDPLQHRHHRDGADRAGDRLADPRRLRQRRCSGSRCCWSSGSR